MSVSNGQTANQTTFNNAFPSKTTDSNITAKYNLNDSGSGGNITNIQQRMNDNTPLVVTNEAIGAGGTISSHNTRRLQIREVSGSGAPGTTSATPFGTSGTWNNGVIIRLIGTDDTNTLTIEHSDIANGVLLIGDITLSKGSNIDFVWISSLSRWVGPGV